jgi:hypothetical protein
MSPKYLHLPPRTGQLNRRATTIMIPEMIPLMFSVAVECGPKLEIPFVSKSSPPLFNSSDYLNLPSTYSLALEIVNLHQHQYLITMASKHNNDFPPVAIAGWRRQLFLVVVLAIIESLQQTAATDTDAIARMGDRLKTTTGTTSTTSFIVSFTDMDVPPAKRCAALAKSMGGTVHQVYDHVLNGCSLIVPPAAHAQSAFTALKNNPITQIVSEDKMVSIDDQVVVSENSNIFEDSTSRIHSSSTVAASSWGLDRINQCALPLDNEVSQQDASGVKVFIVDTGIYAAHEEFANGSIGSDDYHFSAFAGENPLTDSHGHG